MEREGWTYMKRMRTAVVGCGAISDIYLTNMTERFDNLEVVACCANHVEHAQKKAKQYGIEARTYEEILSDPSIELVVILTPAPTHEGLIRQALQKAGGGLVAGALVRPESHIDRVGGQSLGSRGAEVAAILLR